MKKYIKSIIVLTAICTVVAVLLAATNFITAPKIKEYEEAAANSALIEVLPDGKNFTSIDLSSYVLPEGVKQAYKADNGYVITIETAGYGTGMVIMCGIGNDGVVTGATCLSSSETLGHEKTYGEKVKGATVDTIEGIDTVASATMTTQAYKNAVKDALNAATILGGGTADLRSEEEILADNLSAALPAAEGKFTKWFIAEALTDVSEVYVADNGTGYVLVSGETFIAVDADGNVLADVSDDVKATMSANAQAIKSSEMTEIDIADYEDMPKAIDKAYKTASGNYVFELHASGFGKKGESYFKPSGEYIYVKVCITADGTILACETVSQKESAGYGAACAKPEFYSQFNGKDETNYGEIDAISGATITTEGYVNGIKRAFEAYKILEGEV